jgi:hypothetical protein
VRFTPLPLLLPQLGQTYSGAQLPRLRLLAAGNSQSLLETGFGLDCTRDSLLQ